MHVIDMRFVDQPMQRRVDAGGACIQVEGAMRVKTDHGRFALRSLIKGLEREKLVEIQGSEAVELNSAQIPARAFDPKHTDLFPGQWIFALEFRGSIAPAEIGDAFVGAQ